MRLIGSPKLFRVLLIGLSVLVTASPRRLFAQRASFGFVGGTGLTPDFPIARTTYQDSNHPGGLTSFDLFSDPHSFIAGASVEVDIRTGLSLEIDALHRNLDLQSRSLFSDGTESRGFQDVVTTWEFPMVLKYRPFRLRGASPFIEAGPSFRTRHNPGPSEPSQFGATVGVGAEFRLGRFRVSPAIRYTRWQYDGDFPRFATKRDQVEFVTGFSHATSISRWRVGSGKLRFGVIGGTPFTRSVSRRFAEERIDERQGYIGGLALEVQAYKRLSVEVNGLYRPLRADNVTQSAPPGVGPIESRFEFTIVTWQLPVLAKYSFARQSGVNPFVEAGPSFRFAGNLNGSNPSGAGFTAGAGIETAYRAMKITPVVRYTRWKDDVVNRNAGGFRTKPNQVEFLVELTF